MHRPLGGAQVQAKVELFAAIDFFEPFLEWLFRKHLEGLQIHPNVTHLFVSQNLHVILKAHVNDPPRAKWQPHGGFGIIISEHAKHARIGGRERERWSKGIVAVTINRVDPLGALQQRGGRMEPLHQSEHSPRREQGPGGIRHEQQSGQRRNRHDNITQPSLAHDERMTSRKEKRQHQQGKVWRHQTRRAASKRCEEKKYRGGKPGNNEYPSRTPHLLAARSWFLPRLSRGLTAGITHGSQY